MNILHVGWGHPPEYLGNGTVAYVQELCEQLALKGHSNTLLAASPLQVEGERKFAVCRRTYREVDVHAVTNRHAEHENLQHPVQEISDPECEKVFRQTLDKVEPDMVHFHSLSGLCASLIPTAQEWGVPSVVSMHDYWLMCPRRDLLDRSGQVCSDAGNGAKCGECIEYMPTCESAQTYADRYESMMGWLCEADMVVAESDFMRRSLVTHGIPESRITDIRPAAKTAEALWAWKHRSHDAGGPLNFGYIGAISRTKGPHLLVEAASMLSDLRERFRISIQGTIADPDYAREIEEQVLKLQYQLPAVGLENDYEPGMLHRILSEMDVCVVPTLWPDNAPRTAMEALGARVPVIGSMVGGIPDLAQHGVNGLLFERGNAESLSLQMRCIIEHQVMPHHLRVRITAPRPMAVHAGEMSALYETLAIRAAMRHGPSKDVIRKAA